MKQTVVRGVSCMGLLLGVLAACSGSHASPVTNEVAAPSTPSADARPVGPAPMIEERVAVASPATPAEFVGKHVLVELGTPLRVAAKADAAAIVMVARDGHDVRARAFEVVGHENGFLTLVRAKPEARCDDGLPELDPYHPQLFVTLDQVARVVARGAVQTFADGTSVGLRPGVLVGPGERVDAGGVELAFAVDPRDVATAFTPAMATAPVGLAMRVGFDRTLRYGAHELVVRDHLFVDQRGVLALSSTLDGTDMLVEVANPCATVRGRAAPGVVGESWPRPDSDSDVWGGLDGSASIVAKGTSFWWADGTAGGELRTELRFEKADATKPTKANSGKSCFRVEAMGTRVAPFEICVARRDVTADDPS